MDAPHSNTSENADTTNQSRMTLPFLEITSFWANVSVIVLTVLLAFAGVIAFILSTRLNDAKDAALTRFKIESEAEIASAKARSSEANEKAEKAKEEAARLNQLAEEEHLARVEIEERVASRRIPEKLRSKLAFRLKSFAGQTISLWFNAGDHEAFVFASDIATALEAAQWNVYAPATIIHMLGSGHRGPTIVETGVVVVSTGDDPSAKASAAIVRELLALGFDARKSPKIENRTESVVIINVEARPEGAQGEAKLRKGI